MWEYGEKNRDFVPKIGDSATNAGRRLTQFIMEAESIFAGREIAAITHGGIIADFLINNFPMILLAELLPNFPEQQGRIIYECSITTIIFNSGHYSLKTLANIDHL